MRAELAGLNHCAVPFLSHATAGGAVHCTTIQCTYLKFSKQCLYGFRQQPAAARPYSISYSTVKKHTLSNEGHES